MRTSIYRQVLSLAAFNVTILNLTATNIGHTSLINSVHNEISCQPLMCHVKNLKYKNCEFPIILLDIKSTEFGLFHLVSVEYM